MSDGGTTAEAGCAPAPITSAQAAAAYASDSKTTGAVTAEENTVPGLWQEMQAQLFTGNVSYVDPPAQVGLSFLYRKCGITPVGEGFWNQIVSGAATGGAFYYSYEMGSGVTRTVFAKLTPEGSNFIQTKSDGYSDSTYGPFPLVIALVDRKLSVYRPANYPYPHKVNQWQVGTLIGTLKDFGSHLAIVDADGREIPTGVP